MELLKEKEMAEKLGVSMATMVRLRRKGMQFVRVGKSPRYNEKEVEVWLRGQQGNSK